MESIEKTISRQEYLEALDIVEIYHRQFRSKNINVSNLTPITDWDKFNKCSLRLRNVLYDILKGIPKYVGYQESFIEKIDIQKMKKLPNCGIKSVNEFRDLRGY